MSTIEPHDQPALFSDQPCGRAAALARAENAIRNQVKSKVEPDCVDFSGVDIPSNDLYQPRLRAPIAFGPPRNFIPPAGVAPGEWVSFIVLTAADQDKAEEAHKEAERWLAQSSACEVLCIEFSDQTKSITAQVFRRSECNPVLEVSIVHPDDNQTAPLSLLCFYGSPENVPERIRKRHPEFDYDDDISLSEAYRAYFDEGLPKQSP